MKRRAIKTVGIIKIEAEVVQVEVPVEVEVQAVMVVIKVGDMAEVQMKVKEPNTVVERQAERTP